MGQCISKSEGVEQNNLLKSTIEKQNNLIDSVLQEKKFQLYSITEFGNFGPTINIKILPMKEEIAVKILDVDNIGPEEIQWYTLYNDNILSLIHIEFVEKIDVFLFYAEDWDYSLKEVTEYKLLRSSEDGLGRVMKWMKQITAGLEYLHFKKYFHLNISTKNVVITQKDDSKISNFHWMCSGKEFSVKRIGLPEKFFPPEALPKEKDHGLLNPEKLEVWSLGILMVNMFTGEHLSRKLPSTVKIWTKDIYPVMYGILQKKKFHPLVKKSFPASHKSCNLEAIRTLASYVLSVDPIHRPPVRDVMYLLNTLDVKFQLQDGNMWKKKVGCKKLEMNLTDMTEENPERAKALKSIETFYGGGDSLAPGNLEANKKKNKIEERLLYKTEGHVRFSTKEINLREVKKKEETNKISQSKEEKLSEREKNDESKKEDSKKEDSSTTENNFSIGKQLYRLINWSIGASYSYEMTSSSNYLNQLSKQLTK